MSALCHLRTSASDQRMVRQRPAKRAGDAGRERCLVQILQRKRRSERATLPPRS